MLQFDVTAFYSLLETFSRTGRLMFPDSWTGTKAWARRVDDPHATQAERQGVLDRIRALHSEKAQYDAILGLDLPKEEHAKASEALYPIGRELKSLEDGLRAIPHIADSWLCDFKAYGRRRAVENELRMAFAEGDLSLQIGASMIVEWSEWSRHRSFQVHFGLSMIRVPRPFSGHCRRGPAFIKRVEFDTVANRFERSGADRGDLTPEARLRDWLKDQVRAVPNKGRTKDDFWTEAKTNIPNLSRRAFERVWGSTVPASWKKAGPVSRS